MVKYWSQAERQPGAGLRRHRCPPSSRSILTLPALVKVDIDGAPVPVAFFAVVSIGVIGLYLAFAIPIYLRWKAGDSVQARRLDPGPQVQVDVRSSRSSRSSSRRSSRCCRPRSLGVPWNDGFAWKYVNYTILVVPGALILLWIYWHLSVKHWFTGPKNTIDLPLDVSAADQISHGHHHRGQDTAAQ